MANQTITADKVQIHSIVMNSDRFSAPLDIKASTIEVNIFENINSAYLTGNLTMLDDYNLFAAANIQGTERIKFIYECPPQLENEGPIEKNFVVTNVQSLKSNDNEAVLVLNLMEDIGWFNNVQVFSKAYHGSGEEIIQKILKDKLKTELNPEVAYAPSYQSEFIYTIPYITPLEACYRVKKKMTTQNGMPYFLYSALNSDKPILRDLETILRQQEFNFGRPFKYSQASTNEQTGDLYEKMFTLDTFTENKNEDTLLLAQNGAITSLYANVDITTGLEAVQEIDVTTVINRLVNSGVISPDHNMPLVDTQFVPNPDADGNRLRSYVSRAITEFSLDTTVGTPYNGFSSETNDEQYYLRIVRKGMLQHLLKNTYQMSGPGMIFSQGATNTTVGNQILIHILKNQMPVERNEDDLIDYKRSGKFIIMAKRHAFDVQEGIHRYSMECSRLTNLTKAAEL